MVDSDTAGSTLSSLNRPAHHEADIAAVRLRSLGSRRKIRSQGNHLLGRAAFQGTLLYDFAALRCSPPGAQAEPLSFRVEV